MLECLGARGNLGCGSLGRVGLWVLPEKLDAKGWGIKGLWVSRTQEDARTDGTCPGRDQGRGDSSGEAEGGGSGVSTQEYIVSCSHSWMFTWICPVPSLSRDLKARNMASSLTKQLMKLSKSMFPASSE